MSLLRDLDRKSVVGLLIALSLLSVIMFPPAKAFAAPSGNSFDHIVIIAMENQHYANVLGNGSLSGCPTGTAPFLCSMLPYSSTIPNYHSYGAHDFSGDSISGCSAACYVALTTGSTYGVGDGYCNTLSGCSSSPTWNGPNIITSLNSAGLTWQAYCESGCPRYADHFPFVAFSNTYNSPNTFDGSSVSTSNFIAAANSASPPNFLWYTPTDSHNMHSVSISTGDSYLKSFLVGTGSMASPSTGSLLASSLFTSPTYHTLLYIWWDEYDPSPNIEFGTPTKAGYVSSNKSYDEYATLHTIESNWALSTLGYASSAPIMSDIFGTSQPVPDFTISATSISGITVGQSASSTITVTAQNGFTGTVTLTDAVPSSLTCSSITPNTITGSGKATVSCSATTPGSFIATVTGTNGSLVRTATATFNVGTQPAPVLYVPSTEAINELTGLSFSVNATDASVPALTLTLTASHLPSGATFRTSQGTSRISGTFAWTPTEAQAPATFTLRFNVTDGVTITQGLVVLTVIEPSTPPTVAAPGSQTATVGKTLAFTITATDRLVPGDPVTLTATGLAPNMAFNPASGAFTFTPSQSQAGQTFTVNFIATYSDNPSVSSTRSTTLQVQNGSSQPPTGGICLSCLLPNGLSTSVWLFVIGGLIGIISTIAVLNHRAHARLTRARNKSHSE